MQPLRRGEAGPRDLSGPTLVLQTLLPQIYGRCVAMVAYRDKVLMLTEQGALFSLREDEHGGYKVRREDTTGGD